MDENYLPEIGGVSKGPRKGRNVYEGYQRGWGLQFTDLSKKILNDRLYQEAMELVGARTVLAEKNRMNIFLILKYFLKNLKFGHIVEFGSYLGGNAIFMAYVVDQLYPGMKVYALDTFYGMPKTDTGVDAHGKGDFSDVDLKELRNYIGTIGVTNLELREGLFEDTAPVVMRETGHIRLAHIDCDILSSVSYSYKIVKRYLVKGAYIVFDDATVSSCVGATEAVEDLVIRRDRMNCEQIYPHFVFRKKRRSIF
jgi:predicted O-methyltransferase YrrM